MSGVSNRNSPSHFGRYDSMISYGADTVVAPEDDPYSDTSETDLSLFLQLKGQMIFFANWRCIAFLGAPK